MAQLNTRWGRIKAHLEAWFVDHELLRALFRNFYAISDKAYRSNHPSPSFIKKLHKKQGINTIISLRRANTTGQYLLEKETCDQLSITLSHVPMSSRSMPKVENILKAKETLETAQYPILIHCKSGADRAGLLSVLYEHWIEKKSIEESLKQLSIKYGHFRWAETGKLDYFFDAFLAFQKKHPEIPFIVWVTQHYDRQALNDSFQSAGWANIVVNKILRRE
ncbi:MAG: tyrosine-protein phosphatase [Thiomicrorhabdus sp.]|nr:tyrosine-protein phosphatase [Thiomicrorhabdus sp.]